MAKRKRLWYHSMNVSTKKFAKPRSPAVRPAPKRRPALPTTSLKHHSRDLDAQLHRAEALGHQPAQGWLRASARSPAGPLQRIETDATVPVGEGVPQVAAPEVEVAGALRALAEQVAHSRLQEGTGRGEAVHGTRKLLPSVRRCAPRLTPRARRDLAFLCAVAWHDQGPFWAKATLGATDYAAAHNLQYTLPHFDLLRRQIAVSDDPPGELKAFLALEAPQLPYLPGCYRQLLHGWVASHGSAERKATRGAGIGAPLDDREHRQANEAARVDRLLFQLTAIVEARGISADAGRAVAAAMIEPQIFRSASRQQRASFLASALAAGDDATVSLLLELTPASMRGPLTNLARHARAMHWDVTNWLLTNLESEGLVAAHADVHRLTSKPYWGRGMPRYAAMDDRRKLVYTIQARLQATSQSARNVATTQAAYDGLLAIREEIIDASTARDAAVLRTTSTRAIVETDLPETSLEQAYMGELFGAVGLDPDQGRKYAPSELLIKGLRALAERAGVDVDALLATLGKGKKALLALAKDPGRVLAFTLGALHGAFGRLKANFPSIMGKSLLAVITGPKAGTDIQPPPQWNKKSTVGFMMQMAGLGIDRVRKLVARLAGERGAAFVERVEGPIMTLFSGKPSKVMEIVEGQIGEAKTTAFGAAKSWLLENVVTRSVIKLATMFSPVGAAMAAIQTIGNLIAVLGTWGNQIATVVTSFMDSMTLIAEGKVKPAADRIFDAIVNILPAIMSFLVGLVFGGSSLFTKLRVGMAAFGDRIWQIVVRIVTAVVERVKKMFSGKKAASAGQPEDRRSWWQRRREFRAGQEVHHAFFVGDRLKVASGNPRTLDELKSDVEEILGLGKGFEEKSEKKEKVPEMDLGTAFRQAERLVGRLERLKLQNKQKKRLVTDKDKETMDQAITSLRDLLVQIQAHSHAGDTKLSYGDTRDVAGFAMGTRGTANPLTLKATRAARKKSSSMFGNLWKTVSLRKSKKNGKKGYYERTHLLNHRMGGPESAENLTILSHQANKDHSAVESRVLDEAWKNARPIKYEVKVSYEQSSQRRTSLDRQSKQLDHLVANKAPESETDEAPFSKQIEKARELLEIERQLPSSITISLHQPPEGPPLVANETIESELPDHLPEMEHVKALLKPISLSKASIKDLEKSGELPKMLGVTLTSFKKLSSTLMKEGGFTQEDLAVYRSPDGRWRSVAMIEQALRDLFERTKDPISPTSQELHRLEPDSWIDTQMGNIRRAIRTHRVTL